VVSNEVLKGNLISIVILLSISWGEARGGDWSLRQRVVIIIRC